MLVLILSGPRLEAKHGTTTDLEQQRKEFDKRFGGKVLNQHLPIIWSDDGTEVFYHLEKAPRKKTWHALRFDDGSIRVLEKPPEHPDKDNKKQKSESNPASNSKSRTGSKSPDGKHQIQFVDGDIRLVSGEQDRLVQKVPDDKSLHWEDRVLWSPDSSRFVVWKNTRHPVREVHYVRSSPDDQVQPEHFSKPYPKPGDPLNITEPVICFVDDRPAIEIEAELIKNPFSLRAPQWRNDSQRFTFEYIERGFGSHRLIEMNTETGQQRKLIDEHDDKFVFVFGNSFRNDLGDGNEILWLSERDGWNHLYLIDGITGKVIRPLTTGKWLVREVVHVDEKQRSAIVSIAGYYRDQDPYHLHFARVNFDDGKMTLLTDGDGTHSLSWSPDRRHYVAVHSRVDQAPTHELRSAANGSLVATLATGSLVELKTLGWQAPRRLVAKDRNDEYDIHGIVLLPPHFDPETHYPVIEAIYAGPHGSYTPRTWKLHHGVMTEMAEAGFIVVKLDALGTNHRGRAFQQVAYKNLIDSGFPDRIKWMQAAAEKIPQMDLNRVGIYGGSAGGQSTLAGLLTHPDFYRAGAADCGCHDNRMDKMWWNEQWMDWPVDESYESNSNLTHIDKLEGHLLLTVGEVDTNVDPASTLQVVDALIRADKDFEFLLVPNGKHGVGEKPYLRRKRIEFFQRHLGGPN